ncbi:flap structure-specific endonuclease [Halobaculum limi]|uniref:flap structure-specific endonuclease n=1 Tax=Halobaculum limi TaxID=3031916 RepID=UPI0024063CC2|nr:flap structure-specific endonuclease [Halobaculum sp. YSMS11]
MGVAPLREIAVASTIDPADLRGETGAVDAYNWLYRYLTVTVRYTDPEVYTTAEGTQVPNLVGVIRGLPKFFEYQFFPIFVFDGTPAPLKNRALARRRRERQRAAERAADAREHNEDRVAARYASRSVRITETIRRTTRELYDMLDVPFLDAPGEAEAQAAHMARAENVDYAVTDDYDALLYGTPLTVRQFTSAGAPECMAFEATLERHDISWEQLVDVAILCGTDYNDGVPGVGAARALALIRRYGDLDGALAAVDASVAHADRIRAQFLEPSVTDDYKVSPSWHPDLPAARSFILDEWEIPASVVAPAFERLEAARDAWA